MRDAIEPTDEAIAELAKKPGTYYLHVGFRSLINTRKALYAAINAEGKAVHTVWLQKTRQLKVTVSE